MEGKLLEAACTGDLNALYESVREDRAILQKLHSRRCANTPLHLASMYGHADFVGKYIIWSSISTQQLCQLNQDGYSAMHLSSTNGHTEIVRFLLEFGNKNSAVEDLCLKKDRDGGTALHSAVATGSLDVIEMLFAACPKAVKQVTFDDESVLHIAVKQYQLEALKLLMEKLGSEEETLLNLRDLDGNTVLDLATARRKHQHVAEASSQDEIKNKKGTTELSDVRNGIIVMATIVMTLTFQVALTPPGGEWQDSGPNAGKSILYDSNHLKYGVVLYCNMNAFLLSVFIIFIALHTSKFGYDRLVGVALEYTVNVTIVFLLVEFFSILFLTMDKMYRQAAFIVTAVLWCMFIAFLSLLAYVLKRQLNEHQKVQLNEHQKVGWRDAINLILKYFGKKLSRTSKGGGSNRGNESTKTRTHQGGSFGGESHTMQSTSRACEGVLHNAVHIEDM